MMAQTIYRVARMTSLLAGITTSFFLLCLALPHRLITFQLFVFVILKLSKAKKNYDAGCAAAIAAASAAYDLPKAWYDDLDPSSPTAAGSYYASPHEPVPPPEIIKEVPEEEEVVEKDIHEAVTTSMDETWRGIMEARGKETGRALDRSNPRDRYRRRVEPDVERASSTYRRELLRRRRSGTYSYKKKDHKVDVKALQKEEEPLGAWGRPREVIEDVGHDELFRQVEAFIRMQHYLRQQQLESERRRRFLERLHLRSS